MHKPIFRPSKERRHWSRIYHEGFWKIKKNLNLTLLSGRESNRYRPRNFVQPRRREGNMTSSAHALLNITIRKSIFPLITQSISINNGANTAAQNAVGQCIIQAATSPPNTECRHQANWRRQQTTHLLSLRTRQVTEQSGSVFAAW